MKQEYFDAFMLKYKKKGGSAVSECFFRCLIQKLVGDRGIIDQRALGAPGE